MQLQFPPHKSLLVGYTCTKNNLLENVCIVVFAQGKRRWSCRDTHKPQAGCHCVGVRPRKREGHINVTIRCQEEGSDCSSYIVNSYLENPSFIQSLFDANGLHGSATIEKAGVA